MLDSRIYTFLKLCDVMNYRVSAEQLNMTQPAVTQHIQFLEKEYDCRLFSYDGRKLSKTKEGETLEQYARSAVYNETALRRKLAVSEPIEVRIGATKTIGDFVIHKQISDFLGRIDYKLSVTVDNTEHLLNKIDHNELDFALIEGFFDRNQYGCKLLRKEPFVGICAKAHPFAGREIGFKDLFAETLLIRELGSGTRAILEQVLMEYNFSLDNFNRTICISSFELIKKLVSNGSCVSFVYDAVAKSSDELASFTIADTVMTREFNYVYLKNTSALALIEAFETSCKKGTDKEQIDISKFSK